GGLALGGRGTGRLGRETGRGPDCSAKKPGVLTPARFHRQRTCPGSFGLGAERSRPRRHPPRTPKYGPFSSKSTSPWLQRNIPLKPHPHSKYRSSYESDGNNSAAFSITGSG